jgi:pyruvate dehydrogenase (quinone)
MLAIAAQIPCNEIGSSYFQETHPEHVFWAMQSLLRASFSPRADAPAFLEIAIQTAIARRRISVVAIPGDIALRESVESRRLYFPPPRPTVCPSEDGLTTLASIVNKSSKITILGCAGWAGADPELIALADQLKAPIVHALRG